MATQSGTLSSAALLWSKAKQSILLLTSIAIGMMIWFSPVPEGITEKAWHLLSIFVATIFAVIAKPLPMAAVSLLSLTFAILSKTLTFEEAFSGFSNDVVWLIVMAFFIAKGFVSTGLGNRIAYFFMKVFGKTTLGLGYGVVLTDLILSPTIPSVTARSGGVIYPILKSLAKAFNSEPGQPSSRKIGSFLMKAAFQGSAITSGMFLTAMSGNPLMCEMARGLGIEITWGKWALATLVPGLCSLILVPFLIYKLYPPEIKKTPDAAAYATKKIEELGKMKKSEWLMFFTFLLLVGLWIFGGSLGVKPVTAALLGISILLVAGVFKWEEVLQEKGAWDTLIWFSSLVTLASFLNKFGLTAFVSNHIVSSIQTLHWITGFSILALLYFYSHYFFASNVAHIGAMYAPFLVVAVAIGTPPMLAALLLAIFSNLFGGLTHYGSGPAPILYGAGFVPVGAWWKIGGIVSVVNVLIWMLIGGAWWKFIGLW